MQSTCAIVENSIQYFSLDLSLRLQSYICSQSVEECKFTLFIWSLPDSGSSGEKWAYLSWYPSKRGYQTRYWDGRISHLFQRLNLYQVCHYAWYQSKLSDTCHKHVSCAISARYGSSGQHPRANDDLLRVKHCFKYTKTTVLGMA